jgi:pimeloyl-ACP methyl ester carboxylesterase
MASAKANGITVEYESIGETAAPTILLIMGLGMQLTGWPDPFCASLAQRGFRVIRFDNRDIGLSSHFDRLGVPNLPWAMLKARLGLRVRSAYSLDDMASDTEGLMQSLAIGSAHVVGASMGGMIAQKVAARFPARVRSLTSIMSTSGARGLPAATREAQRALFGRPRDPRNLESVVDHYVGPFNVIASPGFPTDRDELRARLETSVRRSFHPQGVARQLLAVIEAGDRSADLRAIRAPTLVIHGDRDPLVPLEGGRDTAAKVPGAKLSIVPGMGHDMAAWPVLADLIVAHCTAAAGNPGD